MNIIEIISQDVFDKIRGRFENVEMGDDQGSVTNNPKDARFFDFDFTVEGNNLGRVSVSLNELGSLKIFYSQGITEGVDSITLKRWYDFLKEMRYFAKRRMLRFDTRDITKGNLNKNDFQYLAQTGTKENNMNESAMIGRGPKTSLRKLEDTRLVVRHSKVVDENQRGARSRNISALFIENQDGERYKYPLIHLEGAKAMQRHVANGGRPYDEAGKRIIEMSEQIAQLVAFKRHVGHHDGMNQEVNEILERSQNKLNELRHAVKSLTGQKAYEAWIENLQPQQDDGFEMDQATMEDYKSKFTVQNFKEDLAQYFPLIHKIMQEAGEIELEDYVSETDDTPVEVAEENTERSAVESFDYFEDWAEAVTEGTLEPDTIMALKDLLDSGLTYGGPDATGAIEALQGIGVHNEALEKALAANAELNPEGDPKDTILSWLMKDDPEAAQELGATAPAPEPVPAPEEPVAAPAPEEPAPAPAPAPVAEMGDDSMDNEEPSYKQPTGLREIAEVVKSFYDKETGKFPKGETGVVIHCKKMFGDKGGQLAERLVAHLSAQGKEREAMQMQSQQFEDIMQLAGIQQEGIKDVAKKVGGALKTAGKKALDTLGHGSDDDLIRDLQKKSGVPQHGKKGMAQSNEDSHQADTTMKHIKNPTAGEKKAAKDIKPGIAGYKDRVDMLKSAEKDGRLKQDESFDVMLKLAGLK